MEVYSACLPHWPHSHLPQLDQGRGWWWTGEGKAASWVREGRQKRERTVILHPLFQTHWGSLILVWIAAIPTGLKILYCCRISSLPNIQYLTRYLSTYHLHLVGFLQHTSDKNWSALFIPIVIISTFIATFTLVILVHGLTFHFPSSSEYCSIYVVTGTQSLTPHPRFPFQVRIEHYASKAESWLYLDNVTAFDHGEYALEGMTSNGERKDSVRCYIKVKSECLFDMRWLDVLG